MDKGYKVYEDDTTGKTYVAVENSKDISVYMAAKIANRHFKVAKKRLYVTLGYAIGDKLYINYPEHIHMQNVYVVYKE